MSDLLDGPVRKPDAEYNLKMSERNNAMEIPTRSMLAEIHKLCWSQDIQIRKVK